jgi:hypothetical protein
MHAFSHGFDIAGYPVYTEQAVVNSVSTGILTANVSTLPYRPSPVQNQYRVNDAHIRTGVVFG